MIRSVAAMLTTLMLCAIPARVWACPVCSPGRDDAAREAFFNTTMFLTLLPLAMFGGIVYWIVKRARAADYSPREPTEPTAPSAVPNLRG